MPTAPLVSTVLYYVVGSKAVWNLQYKVNGEAQDITGASLACQVRRDYADVDPTVLADATCTVVDGPNGLFSVALSAAQTSLLPAYDAATKKAITYRWDVDLVFPAEDPVTIGTGILRGQRQVTTS